MSSHVLRCVPFLKSQKKIASVLPGTTAAVIVIGDAAEQYACLEAREQQSSRSSTKARHSLRRSLAIGSYQSHNLDGTSSGAEDDPIPYTAWSNGSPCRDAVMPVVALTRNGHAGRRETRDVA